MPTSFRLWIRLIAACLVVSFLAQEISYAAPQEIFRAAPLAAERGDETAATLSPAALADPVRGKLVVVIDDDPLVLDGMS